jgi:hypothetical protein
VGAPAFLAAWARTLPQRWRRLLVPYLKALVFFMVVYAGATALFQPWALGRWWSFWVPMAAGFGVCWWLWRSWALLATNNKGESRRVPLLFTWVLLVALGWHLRDFLRYRLGEVRDVRSVRELAQPGNAVFFRLHGPFYVDKDQVGEYATQHIEKQKGNTKRYWATNSYACPLLPTAADTVTAGLTLQTRPTPPAWLAYPYQQTLGDDLPPGERDWRYANFEARSAAQFDSLNVASFTYLLRMEGDNYDLHRAVRASRLAPYWGSPLLLRPIRAPFAQRGTRTARGLRWLTLLGSLFICFLLVIMPLRPGEPAA